MLPAIVLAALAGVAATMSTTVVVIAVGAIIALALRARSLTALLFLAVCTLGLARRLVTGGRVEADPLLLVPVALLVWAIMRSERRREERVAPSWIDMALVGLMILPVVAWAVTDRTTAGLYVAGLYSTSFLAISAARSRLLPDIRTTLSAAAPWFTIALSGYGLYQFFVLPSWDRSWMVASELRSIGLPLPEQVRVFGSAESPGPFATILGALIILLLHRLLTRGESRRGVSAIALVLAVPTFFLTGVRTGLLALALVAFLVLFKTRRPSVAVLFALAAAGLATFGRRVIEAAGSQSSVWSLDRYSGQGLGSDRSLQQRLLLLDQVGPASTRPLGSGFGGARADNMFVDLLLAAGPIAALLALAVTAAVVLRALRYDWRSPDAAWHMVAVYTAVFTLAGPVFATTSGLVVAIVWGWVLMSPTSPTAVTDPTRSGRGVVGDEPKVGERGQQRR